MRHQGKTKNKNTSCGMDREITLESKYLSLEERKRQFLRHYTDNIHFKDRKQHQVIVGSSLYAGHTQNKHSTLPR